MTMKQAIYIKCNIVAHSHNHCCSGNTTMPSVCVLGVQIIVNYIKKNTECCTTGFYANFMLRDNLLHSSVFESAAI